MLKKKGSLPEQRSSLQSREVITIALSSEYLASAVMRAVGSYRGRDGHDSYTSASLKGRAVSGISLHTYGLPS